ncbi:50S ribosomal protein L9 [Borrelia sp. A-FGy1]|uniref:50S ribosomal protein L9 n=1 Tax=Borrelia sp. A-FGy1 TaxID=2608247 RepID=UPI0015F389CC|nr:50S ribosomal protein L9 [Borrelia sp. A-FGy1]QMU98922.1 50S ribosomal protein L9 [Borrelia sp. A-FGy1]
MKVILKEDFINLGKEGDTVDVKDGFARNYLLPKGFAVFANSHNIDIFRQKKRSILKRQDKKRRLALELKEKLDVVKLEFVMQSSGGEKLFHSINSSNISDELLKLGFEIERRKIDVHHGMLKTFGVYDITIKLYEGIHSVIKVEIKKEDQKNTLKKSKRVEKEA